MYHHGNVPIWTGRGLRWRWFLQRLNGSERSNPAVRATSVTGEHSLPDDGLVLVRDGTLTVLTQQPPERGLIVVDGGDTTVFDGPELAMIEQLLDELGYDTGDRLADGVVAALKRLEELERATALFRGE